MIVNEWCMYCGECAGVCPQCVIEVCETGLKFDEQTCEDCKFCVMVCPVGALEKDEQK
ncbi:MAG: ferredoxin [Euryarchaeota archaeon]|nr:ferredoxin [Euryarchaeota archaeon]